MLSTGPISRTEAEGGRGQTKSPRKGEGWGRGGGRRSEGDWNDDEDNAGEEEEGSEEDLHGSNWRSRQGSEEAEE